VLDLIMCDDSWMRWYAFDATRDVGESLAAMETGSGHDYSITFLPEGAFIRGYDGDSPIAPYRLRPPRVWPGLLESVPSVFHAPAHDPLHSHRGVLDVTVALWRRTDDDAWSYAEPAPYEGLPLGDRDGSEFLFQQLDGRAESYAAFAASYYEIPPPPLEPIEHVLAQRPLTDEIVTALNPDNLLAALADNLRLIDYPTGG